MASTAFPTDANWYTWFTDAENQIKLDISATVPNAMMGAPTLMTSADSGYTYTFGTDAGTNAIFPIGAVQIYGSQSDIPFNPYIPGQDYTMEGTKIRWVQNRARTFSAGPYGRWVTPTYLIDGSTAPTLPLLARILIVYKAAAIYASSGGQQDPTPYLAMYADAYQQSILPALKKQFLNQGGAAMLGRRRQLPWVTR